MAKTGDQELDLLHVDMEPFTSHASLPCIELVNTHLLDVHNEYQVISVEKLQWHTSADLKRNRLQQLAKEQWAKVRTLMHTNSYAKLVTVLISDPLTTMDIGISASDDTHNPFLDTEAP